MLQLIKKRKWFLILSLFGRYFTIISYYFNVSEILKFNYSYFKEKTSTIR